MFRRLAQLMTNEPENFDVDQTHRNFLTKQAYRYNTLLPNIIPTDSSFPAPDTLKNVMGSVNTVSNQPIYPKDNIDRLFQISSVSKSLQDQIAICKASSLNGLLTSQDQSKPMRCGWAYTPPPNGSSIPAISQGAFGNSTGPLSSANPPGSYTQWFWNLDDAKKQTLTDTCKALKNCADVGSAPFNGQCGYCSDLGQGIPVDENGNPLYTNSTLTNCSPGSIITSPQACPPKSTTGLTGQTDNTCKPIGGRLPFGCLESIIESNGCSQDGALFLSLSSGSTPNDYMASARQLKSLRLYNDRMKPPLNVDAFAQANAATMTALNDNIKTLYSAATTQPPASAIGASARDLCIKAGSIDAFDFCSDITLTTPGPYDIGCTQKAFLKAGGTPMGLMYPAPQNMAYFYNTKPTWKDVTDYINSLAFNARGSNQEAFTDMLTDTRNAYQIQANSLMALRGITPDKLSTRVPLIAGVELFWYDIRNNILLNNTIESALPIYNYSTGVIPQLGFVAFGEFVALTDIRTVTDTSMQFYVLTDDGFIMSLNRPIAGPNSADTDGNFAANFIQATTAYQNKTCWSFSGINPNIMKIWWNDSGAGQHTFSLTATNCGSAGFQPMKNMSLTREIRGPFLIFENSADGQFQDLRMSEFFNFSQGQKTSANTNANIQNFYDADSKLRSGFTNGFVHFNAGASSMILRNVSSNAWTTMTFVFRVTVMPVNDFILQFNMNGAAVQLYISPINGSTSVVNYYTTLGQANPQAGTKTGVNLTMGLWYMGTVTQNGSPSTSITFSFMDLETAKQRTDNWFTSNTPTTSFTISNSGAPISNVPSNTFIIMGTGANAILQWDLAWWHFFNGSVIGADIQRDALNNWLLTLPQ